MSLPIYTSTTKEVSCPRCNAQPGEGCKTPKGKETRRPHVERLKAYRESISPEEFKKRHALKGAVFGTDILKEVAPVPNQPAGEPITVLANKQPLTIHSPGFAVLVHQGGIRLDVPDFFEINGRTTLACIDTLNDRHWQHISTGPIFKELFHDVFQDRVKIPATIQELKDSGFDVQHVTGMIISAVEAIFAAQDKKQNIRLFFREPEAHLHPAEQLHLMDMINKLRRMAGQNVEETMI